MSIHSSFIKFVQRIKADIFRPSVTMVAIVSMSVWLCGCMIPFYSHRVYEGVEIRKESLSWVQAGETTRAQVVENLGAPDIDFVDRQTVVYTWSGQSGGLLLVGPYSAFIEPIRMRRALMILFGQDNKVKAFSIINRQTEVIPYDSHSESLDAKYDDWVELLDQWQVGTKLNAEVSGAE